MRNLIEVRNALDLIAWAESLPEGPDVPGMTSELAAGGMLLELSGDWLSWLLAPGSQRSERTEELLAGLRAIRDASLPDQFPPR